MPSCFFFFVFFAKSGVGLKVGCDRVREGREGCG
jgi:hypothetical protein